MDEETTQTEYYAQPLPPEAESIKSLVKITGIISLVFGILNLIWGIAGIIVIVGIVGIIFGIIDLLIWSNCKKINGLIDQRNYKEAKDKTLIWMIIGFIFGGLIPGILLLIAYIKYDEVIRISQQSTVPPPPPS
ncbi:hypothetical protein [Candidatus Aciduliprofundum boonei]|uniref:Uncharacterized protein n=1 Tax=Aciduliprofundum boonei (strain DSM 19572 / T469) TaxID=439481 RepID=B5IHE1_ACIB4|nr:hypothetical protein [Candidatus Aciduliprofundum boonei]ADD08032.1 hypothetical protein Aboo_0220 [Aciduliprofundum boonei T469]EDY34326.1 hypothetical protein ABOONEI_246 [Aciduliprofundum boonei T469]HII55099.1 hypothetical protein [Candidatus Aciduliprofundum boonei]